MHIDRFNISAKNKCHLLSDLFFFLIYLFTDYNKLENPQKFLTDLNLSLKKINNNNKTLDATAHDTWYHVRRHFTTSLKSLRTFEPK